MAGMQTMDSALRHITDHIRAASSNGTALRICGGGSKDFYGNHLEGELLDTRGLSGILSYEPTELVVTVGAGTKVNVWRLSRRTLPGHPPPRPPTPSPWASGLHLVAPPTGAKRPSVAWLLRV